MDYSFLAQDAAPAATTTTTTVRPQLTFFQRYLPFFFPPPQFYPQPVSPACIPVPVPAGTLGRDSNGNLTVNGQTHCYQRPYAAAPYVQPAFYQTPLYSPRRFTF